MNNFLPEIMQYDFFINALVSALLASIICGIIGTYIVAKRLVFISGGITHASFGGIGIGYFFGFNPLLGAALFSVLSALGIEWITKKSDMREDTAIGVIWSFGMAIGIIFVYLTPGYAPNLMTYLFGNILTVSSQELYWMMALSVVIVVFFLIFYRYILYIAFDEEFAKTRKAPVNLIKTILLILIALAIVINIRIAGIILIISLLTIPQTCANVLFKNFNQIMTASIVIGFIGSVSGLLIAYFWNIPSGASIIFTLIAMYILIKLIKFLLFKKK